MYNPIIGSLPNLTIEGLSIKDKKRNNIFIRRILTNEKSSSPKAMGKWKHYYHFSVFKNLWSDIYVIPNKVKETHFKIINRYYPCNDFISSLSLKKGSRHYAVSVKKKMKQLYTYFSVASILNYFGPKFLVSF